MLSHWRPAFWFTTILNFSESAFVHQHFSCQKLGCFSKQDKSWRSQSNAIQAVDWHSTAKSVWTRRVEREPGSVWSEEYSIFCHNLIGQHSGAAGITTIHLQVLLGSLGRAAAFEGSEWIAAGATELLPGIGLWYAIFPKTPIAKDYDSEKHPALLKGAREGCARATAASQFISLRFDNKDGSGSSTKTVQSIVWVGRSVRRELSQEIGATLQRVRMNFNHKNSWCTVAFVSIEAATTTSPLFYHISLDIIQNTLPRFKTQKYKLVIF